MSAVCSRRVALTGAGRPRGRGSRDGHRRGLRPVGGGRSGLGAGVRLRRAAARARSTAAAQRPDAMDEGVAATASALVGRPSCSEPRGTCRVPGGIAAGDREPRDDAAQRRAAPRRRHIACAYAVSNAAGSSYSRPRQADRRRQRGDRSSEPARATALLTPLAMPARSSGAAARTVAVSGATISARPSAEDVTPAEARRASTTRRDRRGSSQRPDAPSPADRPSSGSAVRSGRRARRRAEARSSMQMVIGRVASPASSGAVAADGLQLRARGRTDRAERGVDQQRHRVGRAEGAVAEQAERHHRVRASGARPRRTRPPRPATPPASPQRRRPPHSISA